MQIRTFRSLGGPPSHYVAESVGIAEQRAFYLIVSYVLGSETRKKLGCKYALMRFFR